jgi:hypothetical protein
MHIYPNYIAIPQATGAYNLVLEQLRQHFGQPNATPEQIERAARAGIEISPDDAAALVAPIRTKSKNTWRDGTIATVMKKVADELDDRVLLRSRTARRTVREEGFISTGTLSGAELQAARAADIPVGADQPFMYPTFVIPDCFPSLFIFNRGQ